MALFPIIALLASVASTAAQAAEQKRQERDMNRQLQAELERQRLLQQRSNVSYQQAAQKQTAGEQIKPIEQGQAKFEKDYNAVVGNTPAYGAATPASSDSAASVNTQAQRESVGRAYGMQAGMNERLLQNSVRNTLTNLDLLRTAQEAQRSQAILPYELQAAQQQGGWGKASQALGALSTLAGTAGMMGLGAAPAAPPQTALQQVPLEGDVLSAANPLFNDGTLDLTKFKGWQYNPGSAWAPKTGGTLTRMTPTQMGLPPYGFNFY